MSYTWALPTGCQISTAQKMFGNSSLQLANVNVSALAVNPNTGYDMMCDRFTIEFWLYMTTFPVSNNLLMTFGGPETNFNGGTLNNSIALGARTTAVFTLRQNLTSGSAQVDSTVVPTAGTWNHIAIVANDGALSIWVGGVWGGTIATAYTTGMIVPTAIYLAGSTTGTTNYVDSLRITKNIARYTDTANGFTPPAAAFTLVGDPYASNVVILANMEAPNGTTSYGDDSPTWTEPGATGTVSTETRQKTNSAGLPTGTIITNPSLLTESATGLSRHPIYVAKSLPAYAAPAGLPYPWTGTVTIKADMLSRKVLPVAVPVQSLLTMNFAEDILVNNSIPFDKSRLGFSTTQTPDASYNAFVQGVVLKDGSPVVGARVFLEAPDTVQVRTPPVITKADGSFVFHGLNPLVRYSARCFPPGSIDADALIWSQIKTIPYAIGVTGEFTQNLSTGTIDSTVIFSGGFAGNTPTTPFTVSVVSGSIPSGTTLAQSGRQLQLLGTIPSADPFFSNVKMLFQFNESNGTSSPVEVKGHSYTKTGSPVLSNVAPAYGTTSLYLDGSSYLEMASSSDWTLGTSDFTFEGHFNFKSGGTGARFIFGATGVGLYYNSNQILLWASGNVLATGTTITEDTDYHIALVRDHTQTNNWILYINGVNTITGASAVSLSGTDFRLFGNSAIGVPFYGYAKGVRLTKAVRYTGTFTPPTADLPVVNVLDYKFTLKVSGVSAYTTPALVDFEIKNPTIPGKTLGVARAQSGEVLNWWKNLAIFLDFENTGAAGLSTSGSTYVVDKAFKMGWKNSSTTKIITNTKSKFGSQCGYWSDASAGSWFSKTYEMTPLNQQLVTLANQPFSFEMWVFLTAYPTSGNFYFLLNKDINTGTRDWAAAINSTGNLSHNLWLNNTTNVTVTSSGTVTLNQWVHLYGARNGNNLMVAIDGTMTTANIGNVYNSDANTQITLGASQADTSQTRFQGYMDQVLFFGGWARYTANFTPDSTVFNPLIY